MDHMGKGNKSLNLSEIVYLVARNGWIFWKLTNRRWISDETCVPWKSQDQILKIALKASHPENLFFGDVDTVDGSAIRRSPPGMYKTL